MRQSRSTGILLAVAMLILGLAAPATAKKGGHPGPPSGSGLEVTVEPRGVFMWANSVGDQILFDITVTNSSGEDLTDVLITFEGEPLATVDLARNQSWESAYIYMAKESDLADQPIGQQSEVTVGTVTAEGTAEAPDGSILAVYSDSATAVMTAYPVPPCDQIGEGPFTFTTSDDYSVCGFSGTGDWVLTTTLASNRPPRGKSDNPSANVRDGVPGNWCAAGESVVDGYTVIDYQFLPDDGVCLVGGVGGDPIPVRNHDTFYLATWKGNIVEAAPLPPPPSP